MPTDKHALFSPSRLARIIACPGSVQYSRGLPSPESSSYAKHGTMLHEAVTEALDLGFDQLIHLNPEDLTLVRTAVDYANDLIKSLGHMNFLVLNDSEVSLATWGIPEVYGTLDYALIDNRNKHAHVIDWKFGQGVQVDATYNDQLMAYAAGLTKWPTDIVGVTMHIVQPPLDHVSRFSMTIMELHQWVHGPLASAINIANSPNPPLNPGEKQCRWCDLSSTCKARFEQVQETAAIVFQTAIRNPNQVDIEDLVEIYKKKNLVTQYLKDIENYLTQELNLGRNVPGVKLVRGRGNRKWKSEEAAAEFLANQGFDPDQIYNSKLVSPSQAEKLDKTLKKSIEFQDLYENPEGAPTLVSDTDSRPALNASAAVDVFARFKGQLD